jgi:hypothetical protein
MFVFTPVQLNAMNHSSDLFLLIKRTFAKLPSAIDVNRHTNNAVPIRRFFTRFTPH